MQPPWWMLNGRKHLENLGIRGISRVRENGMSGQTDHRGTGVKVDRIGHLQQRDIRELRPPAQRDLFAPLYRHWRMLPLRQEWSQEGWLPSQGTLGWEHSISGSGQGRQGGMTQYLPAVYFTVTNGITARHRAVCQQRHWPLRGVDCEIPHCLEREQSMPYKCVKTSHL